MVTINFHPRGGIKVTMNHSNGTNWVTLSTDDDEITIFAASTGAAASPYDKRPTLRELADALAQPHFDLDFEAQAAEHDADESNTLPMTADIHGMPF